MKYFDPKRTGFGRHETFPLRFGWLSKGYRAWCENPEVFDQDDPMVVLGVGKNMVGAIRYWLYAAQLVGNDQHGHLAPTDLGRQLFSSTGWDPYLEDDATLWLIHWLIASHPAQATTWWWFFNRYHKPEFSTQEMLVALGDFVAEEMKARVSVATLRNDIGVLLRMYEPSAEQKGLISEESLDSPLSTLGLIQKSADSKLHISRPVDRRRLPLAAFGFAVVDTMNSSNTRSMPVAQLMHSGSGAAAPGSVFRITEECLVTKLEELIRWMPGYFELRETAGIHQLYELQELRPTELLARHYGDTKMERAA